MCVPQTTVSSNTRDGTSADSASLTRAVPYRGANSTWEKRAATEPNSCSACFCATAGFGPMPRSASLHAVDPAISEAASAAAMPVRNQRDARERGMCKRNYLMELRPSAAVVARYELKARRIDRV